MYPDFFYFLKLLICLKISDHFCLTYLRKFINLRNHLYRLLIHICMSKCYVSRNIKIFVLIRFLFYIFLKKNWSSFEISCENFNTGFCLFSLIGFLNLCLYQNSFLYCFTFCCFIIVKMYFFFWFVFKINLKVNINHISKCFVILIIINFIILIIVSEYFTSLFLSNIHLCSNFFLLFFL
jgi:hypothetical protein